MTIITAWSASEVVGSNSREGTDTGCSESMCSRVGGILKRRNGGEREKLSRHTFLPRERTSTETKCSGYVQSE